MGVNVLTLNKYTYMIMNCKWTRYLIDFQPHFPSFAFLSFLLLFLPLLPSFSHFKFRLQTPTSILAHIQTTDMTCTLASPMCLPHPQPRNQVSLLYLFDWCSLSSCICQICSLVWVPRTLMISTSWSTPLTPSSNSANTQPALLMSGRVGGRKSVSLWLTLPNKICVVRGL